MSRADRGVPSRAVGIADLLCVSGVPPVPGSSGADPRRGAGARSRTVGVVTSGPRWSRGIEGVVP
jgi:hypothetical protein